MFKGFQTLRSGSWLEFSLQSDKKPYSFPHLHYERTPIRHTSSREHWIEYDPSYLKACVILHASSTNSNGFPKNNRTCNGRVGTVRHEKKPRAKTGKRKKMERVRTMSRVNVAKTRASLELRPFCGLFDARGCVLLSSSSMRGQPCFPFTGTLVLMSSCPRFGSTHPELSFVPITLLLFRLCLLACPYSLVVPPPSCNDANVLEERGLSGH